MEYNQAPEAGGRQSRQHALWITNMAAPYRIPVWSEIAKHYNLTVGLLESNITLKTDRNANRGNDWLHSADDGIDYIEIPTWKISRGEERYYVLRGLSEIRRIRKADVVLFGGWESPAYWALLVVAVLFRVGRVGFYESPINTMRHRSGPVAWIRKVFFRSMHAVVTPGPAATASLAAMGVRAGKIVEGFNAVNVKAFHDAAASFGDTPASGRKSGHSFLYVGQLISRKRVQNIIDAFRKIGRSEDKLTIVGTGDLAHKLQKLGNSQDERISFLPTIPNRAMPAIMAEHQTLVLASSTEVWGLVVNEALATGMHAVISSNCGVAPSVAQMGGVFLVRPDLSDLDAKMLESRKEWSGRISSPAILAYTPARFANRFVAAFQLASAKSSTRGGV